MTKKNLGRLFRVATLVGGFAAAALIVLYSAFYGKAIENEKVIYISSATTYAQIESDLRQSLRSNLHRTAFDFYAKRLNLEGRFRTGRYLFQEGESVIRAVRKLVLGEQSPVKLVVGEARTLPQLAGKLAKQIEADSATLLSAMRNKQLRKELGFVKDSTIAMFIPNTYEVWWDITPERLLHRIKREYDHFWNEERTAKLKRCGLSKYEVMTLASIVYEEVKIPSEMRMIAGVYINRLRRGIALQACPTVKYAMGDFALQRILHKHLKYRSPFNTYINRGLPPAPICVPSVTAIDAVLNFDKHDYLYFCARPELDGRHNFARTLKEHNANSRKYSAAIEKLGVK
ncbi:MAG: endolytic transglycosylase MltG [Rikenellaceae bacterium]|nr:endolytic transglycosylase MltG [Rikenellaceae bacterium]